MLAHFDIKDQQGSKQAQFLQNQLAHTPHSTPLFSLQTTREWMEEAKQTPLARRLFSEFWLEGELAILFAEDLLGKSILAMQIADSITRGHSIPGFVMEASAQKVLYLDFENTHKQLEARYSNNFSDHYDFAPTLLRAQLSSAVDCNTELARAQLAKDLETLIKESGAKILIVDTITFLKQGSALAEQYAIRLTQQLRDLQRKAHLSILLLAHTPRGEAKGPLTRCKLQGLQTLLPCCQSAFAIGKSLQAPDLYYLKQLKAHSTEVNYHSDHVVVCRLNKLANFPAFHWERFASEYEHCQVLLPSQLRALRVQDAADLRQLGLSYGKIAKLLDIPESTVRYGLKKQNAQETASLAHKDST